ncbi:MAG: cytochrome P450 [Firmicutes bacterium]|nr:cytochrome P450 [Bacillota bacterium]
MATLQAAPGSRVANFFHFRRDPLGFLLGVRGVADIVALSSARAKPSFVLNDPEVIREVLVNKEPHFVKGRSSRILSETLGDGLLTSEGSVHQLDRRMMQPSFHLMQIQSYAETIVRLTDQEIKSWRQDIQSGQTERLVSADLMSLTLRVIMRTMFGDERESAESLLGAAVDECVRYSAHKLYAPVAPPVSWPTPGQLAFRHALTALNGYLDSCMDRASKDIQDGSDAASAGHLLDMLMRHLACEDWPQSREKVRDELITILIAGHETTANALSWALYLLATHHSVQERLQAEVDLVLDGRVPTYDDLSRLTYTAQVIQETLRLYPTAWLLLREAASDVEIGGHSFRRNAVFLISPYAVHRSPEWFDEPLAFSPERFANGVPKGWPRYAYFPFGGGVRSCIGQQFAMMETTLILARLSQAFTFDIGASGSIAQPEPSVSLRITGGLRLGIHPRTRTVNV